MKKILVTGAVGQIGSELTLALREKYGAENVIATGRKTKPSKVLEESGPFHFINVNDVDSVEEIIKKYNIDTIYHMAAILSAVGESNPQLCWDVNMNGTINLLELGIKYDMARLIIPSSIAVWGAGVPLDNTPQESVLRPTTMYGVTKVAGEILCDYYVQRFGLDIRGLRYPGIISSETLPGGGTTDYAVAIYYEAVEKGNYTCFVKEDTKLPMMYMPDCIKATIDLAEAPFDSLVHHSDFNVGAMSFDVKDLADSIKQYIPGFTVEYAPDKRQAIADSWPNSVDDSCAREEWGWKPAWLLDAMTKDMIERLQARHADGKLYQ
ncbi:MAG: NAD-dependent epimerase/dehydratase family protein [FCB group bacterium]|nr:NAD-dependent epimerase/dehydratase family protein [FCB group bacterium]